MKNIWCQNGGNKGISTLALAKKKSKIVLNAVTGSYYVSKEKGRRAFHCLTKEQKGNNKIVRRNREDMQRF